MAAVKVDLHIEQGADWPGLAFPIYDEEGQPYPLDGCTAKGQIRYRPGDEPPLFTWSSNPQPGEGLITLADSHLTVRVLGTESSLWTFRVARYDIELTNPLAPLGRRVIRVASGSVIVDQEVTK